MTVRLARHALLAIPALVLVACGGGGGSSSSGGGTSTDPGLSPNLAITSSNAKPVAADGLDASTNTGAAQVGASVVTGVQVDTGSGTVTVPALSQVAIKLASMAAQGPALATGVAVDRTVACSSGGSIRVTGNVANGSGVAAGDNLSIAATGCSEVIGNATTASQLNGTMSIIVNSGSFTDNGLYPQHLVMSVNANLTVVAQDVTDVTSGDMRIDLTQTSGSASSVTLSGSSLGNSYTRAGSTRSVALKNYSLSQNDAGTRVTTNVTATVVTSNARIGSNVVYTVSTPTPVVTDLGSVLQGSLKIQGARSGLLLSATAPGSFSLQVDTDGDGAYETTTTTTSAELHGLL